MRYRLPGGAGLSALREYGTIAAIELTSIARGWAAADRMVKTAPIVVVDARSTSPGKFLIVVTGAVAALEDALEAGTRAAGPSLFGTLYLPNLSAEVVPAINRDVQVAVGDTVAVVESFSGVGAIAAADAAVKEADVQIESVSLMDGLGGKAFVVLAGTLHSVESAVAAAQRAIPADMFVAAETIAQFSNELAPFLPGRL